MGSGKSDLYHNTYGDSSTQNSTLPSVQIDDLDRADVISGIDANGALSVNLTSDIKNEYRYKNGYFGVSGRNNRKNESAEVRNIYAVDNNVAAKDFYGRLSKGGIESVLPADKSGKSPGVRSKMSDGYWISYRAHSKSDGTPVVQITIIGKDANGQIKKQKIHFVKQEGKK